MNIDIIAPEPVPPKNTYVITLDHDEAVLLKTIVGAISGTGPMRDFTDALYNRLKVPGQGHFDIQTKYIKKSMELN